MSVETRDQKEFERYLEYQRTQRSRRAETLGGAATMLFLTTIDLGVIGTSDPASERRVYQEADAAPEVAAGDLREVRARRLAAFATESAELGYSRAA